MRSPINSLLVLIATMDTFAIMLPVPVFINLISTRNVYTVFPYSWCKSYFLLMYVLPMMCNMASIWITVALACVRFYSVWRPLLARRRLTQYRINIGLTIIVLLSVAIYFPSVFEYNFSPIDTDSMLENVTYVACKVEKTYAHLNGRFCEVHYWIQVILTTFVPWFCMLFPDVGMLWLLKRATTKRNILLNEIHTESVNYSRIENDGNMTCFNSHMKLENKNRLVTWMIFINVTLIWLVEIPFAVAFTQLLLHSKYDFMRHNMGTITVFAMLLKYVTYPVIFLTYCFMSRRFRQAFKDMIFCASIKPSKFKAMNNVDKTKNTSRNSSFSTSFGRRTSSQTSYKERRKSL